jgi:hypothetical protein
LYAGVALKRLILCPTAPYNKARMRPSFLAVVRGTRTTPLREYRAVKPMEPVTQVKTVKEPRQIHWLAYFGGLLALMAVLGAVVQPNDRSIPAQDLAVRANLTPLSATLADPSGPTHLCERTLLSLPNGRPVQTVFKGILPTLPKTGNHEGDMWQVGESYWIWTSGLSGTQALGWVDP